MKKIYIVLTYSGTVLSRIIKYYTKKEYSHVSISLDKDLKEMYSFGRINAYIPFIGGFVQESPKYGTFKRFSKTSSKIYSLEVEDEKYDAIKKIIQEINLDREDYRFNTIGLFAAALHLKIKRRKCFYCAEFVKYLFDNSNLQIDLPEVIKPDDFSNIKGLKEIYTGMLNKYKIY